MPYEHKVKIGNVEYSGSTRLKADSIRINRRLFSDFSVGNVSAAEIELEIWPDPEYGEPPVAAEIIPYIKGIDTVERWVQLGVFYTDERTRNSGTLTLHGYDSMYKANVDFKTYGSVASWPLPMSDVLNMVANTMGIRIDRRTLINQTYMMDYPEDYSCLDILKHIAAAHAGNFIITQMNELLLIPLTWRGTTIVTQTNALSFEKYAQFNPIERVILSVSDKLSYMATVSVPDNDDEDESDDESDESDDGEIESSSEEETGYYTLNVFCPSGTRRMAQNILTSLNGYQYQGFSVSMAAIPPTTQLWDTIQIRNYTGPETYEDFTGQIAEISVQLGAGFYADVSAPGDNEAVHEYISKSSARDVNQKLEETANILREEFGDGSLKIQRYNSNSAFTVRDGKGEVKIIDFDFKAKPGGDVVFHAEIKYALSAVQTVPSGGGVDNSVFQALQAQIESIMETVGLPAGGIEASVVDDVLILTGTGASTKNNHMILISDDVSVSDSILYFSGGNSG